MSVKSKFWHFCSISIMKSFPLCHPIPNPFPYPSNLNFLKEVAIHIKIAYLFLVMIDPCSRNPPITQTQLFSSELSETDYYYYNTINNPTDYEYPDYDADQQIQTTYCAGGSLQECINFCPSDPPDQFSSCVTDCGYQCPSIDYWKIPKNLPTNKVTTMHQWQWYYYLWLYKRTSWTSTS